MRQVASEADRLLGGHPDSCLLIDESGFVKKGKDSAGVARQWCGRLGKLENCQAGVFAASCRAERQIPIDGRLYLPKEWVENRQRCRQAGIPETEIVARSKAQHALAMVQQARADGLRFAWVGLDGGYGKEPWLLRALHPRARPSRQTSIRTRLSTRPIHSRASPNVPPGAAGTPHGCKRKPLASGSISDWHGSRDRVPWRGVRACARSRELRRGLAGVVSLRGMASQPSEYG